VLLLDEATSALDEATEQAIFDSLEALRKEGRTMVIIAHRPSTISRCDRFVRIHEGRIVDSGLTVART
jgi:ATP-binding cassette subfamily B protein